jgi:curved DNA-binding protein CbpA
MARPNSVSIKLRCSSWQQLANIYRRDLTRGAIFLKAQNPPDLGTLVRVDLTLPSDSMIVLSGTVAEVLPPGSGRGPGVDIKLGQVPQSAMWLIETALASQKIDVGVPARPNKPTGRPPMSTAPAVGPGPRAASPGPGGLGAGPGASAGSLGQDVDIDDSAEVADAEHGLVGALTTELEAMTGLNAFQILGVPYDAGESAIRAAFSELSKRYHPDRFARFPSTELRQLAAEIFISLRDAYRRLSDEGSRNQLLAQLGHSTGSRANIPIEPVAKPPERKTGEVRNLVTKPGEAPRPPARVPQPVQVLRPPAIPQPQRPPAAPEPQASDFEPPDTTRRPVLHSPLPVLSGDQPLDLASIDPLLKDGRFDEAVTLYRLYAKKHPEDRKGRVSIELAEGLRALAAADRLEAAQRFETVLELDPSNERAARELASMRRNTTTERKGLLTKLLGKA